MARQHGREYAVLVAHDHGPCVSMDGVINEKNGKINKEKHGKRCFETFLENVKR